MCLLCIQEESKKRYDNYNEILFAWGAHTLETVPICNTHNFFVGIKSSIFNFNFTHFNS